MKRIAAVMVFIFLVVVPRAFPQSVAGEYNPVDIGYDGNPYCDLNFRTGCHVLQPFSLASGAYIDEIDVGLAAGAPNPGGTEKLSILIFPGGCGPDSSINYPPPCATIFSASTTITIPLLPSSDEILFVPVRFPKTWLPAGSYELSLSGSQVSGCFGLAMNWCPLEWAPNRSGSSGVGILGNAFFYQLLAFSQSEDSGNVNGVAGVDGKVAFLILQDILTGPPVALNRGQFLHLVAGPVTPPPGTPVEAHIGFVDMDGKPIGPSSTVTIKAGETQSLDFKASEFFNDPGGIEVRPIIKFLPSAVPSPALGHLSASMQILNAETGLGTLLEPFPGASSPPLVSQSLADGETMRFNAVAGAADSCTGQLSFADKNGNAIGPTMPLDLTANTGTSLDLHAHQLGLRPDEHIDVQPILTLSRPQGERSPLNSVCQVSVEVFNHLTGRTRTYQATSTSLPAVQ